MSGAYDWGLTPQGILEGIALATDVDPDPAPGIRAIEGWIRGYSAEVNVAIRASLGREPSSITQDSDADLFDLCRLKIETRVSSRFTKQNQGVADDYQDEDASEWRQFIDDLTVNGQKYASKTGTRRNIRTASTPIKDVRGEVFDKSREFG